jgi:hypothetical protein
MEQRCFQCGHYFTVENPAEAKLPLRFEFPDKKIECIPSAEASGVLCSKCSGVIKGAIRNWFPDIEIVEHK